MVRRLLAVCVALVTVAGVASAVASADPGQATIFRIKQPSAGAEASFGNCPDVLIPPVGTVCQESYVIVFRETRVLNGGSNAPSQAPWAIYAETVTLTFSTPDGIPDVTDLISGYMEGDQVVASSNDQRVSYLTAAAAVPMSDGSTFDFHGTWSGVGERWVYGNNGPVHEADGLPRHYVDRCTTFNSNDHQTGRKATINGTLNGTPIRPYTFDLLADIFYNHFVYIDVTHGGCK